MKANNVAVIALILSVLLAAIPVAVDVENETIVIGARVLALVCFALCCGLTLRHFLLPKEIESTTPPPEKQMHPRGAIMIGARADNGASISQITGDVTQINEAPKPSFSVLSDSGWSRMDDGRFNMRLMLNIENAFNSNGFKFTVTGDGVESVGILGGNTGLLSTGRAGKVKNGAFIECGTPTNISGISVTSSKMIDGMGIEMDSM